MLPPQIGRWSGKPVQVRRGPATVTGEVPPHARTARATGGEAAGKARRDGPGSQETCLRPDGSTDALAERGAPHMTHRCGRLLAGLVLTLLVAAAPAAADPVTVNLRVEGPTKTL